MCVSLSGIQQSQAGKLLKDLARSQPAPSEVRELATAMITRWRSEVGFAARSVAKNNKKASDNEEDDENDNGQDHDRGSDADSSKMSSTLTINTTNTTNESRNARKRIINRQKIR